MDENYLHDRMNRSNKSYSKISNDNDVRERACDLRRSYVNVNDRIRLMMDERIESITQI